MTEALINPKILEWASDRSDMPPEKLAKCVGKETKPEQIISWQKGESKPTLTQAEKLANALRIPFGYL